MSNKKKKSASETEHGSPPSQIFLELLFIFNMCVDESHEHYEINSSRE